MQRGRGEQTAEKTRGLSGATRLFHNSFVENVWKQLCNSLQIMLLCYTIKTALSKFHSDLEIPMI